MDHLFFFSFYLVKNERHVHVHAQYLYIVYLKRVSSPSQNNTSVFALATSREVLEIEVPDILSLDIMPSGGGEEGGSESLSALKRM